MEIPSFRLIAFAGRAGSGKSTLAKFLVENHGFVRVSFAAPLKAALKAMGFHEPETQAQKEALITSYPFSYRQAAQTLGTEWGRGLDPDLWVKLIEFGPLAQPGKYVIDDLRFENEADTVRRLKGTVVHLWGRQAGMAAATAVHASEQGVVRCFGDMVLDNSSHFENPYSAKAHIDRWAKGLND